MAAIKCLSKKTFNAAQAGVYLDKLTRYAAVLKLAHFNMKKDVDHLLGIINKSHFVNL